MEYLVKVTCEAIWSRAFVCWEFFDYCFNFIRCKISIQILWLFLISFGRLYVSRNLSISSRLSSLLESNIFLQSFVFLYVSCYFSCSISDFTYLGSLSLFLQVWLKVVNLVYLFKEPGLGFIDLLYYSLSICHLFPL